MHAGKGCVGGGSHVGSMSWSRGQEHGAGVEGMGAMEWSGRSGRRGRGERAREGCMEGWGGESGEGGAGGHGLGPFQVI